MGTPWELVGAMSDEAPSGTRQRRRWKILLAHDVAASTCDALFGIIESALGDVEIIDASSVDDARTWLLQGEIDVVLICLDLPPTLIGGVRLAKEIQAHGPPVILITRSQRWLPSDAGALRLVPWITPEATVEAVTTAIIAALDSSGAARSLAELPYVQWEEAEVVGAS